MKTRIIGAILALVLAVAGAFLLVSYVRGADARAAEGAELAEVYVVDKLVPEGTRGEAISEFVKQDSVPVRNINDDAVVDLADLEGLVADAELLPGEQVIAARFVDPLVRAAAGEVDVPEGMQEVSFALPVQRMVGGEIRPGSTVGIVVTKYEAGVNIETGAPIAIPETQFAFNRVLVTATRIGENVSSESESDEDPETGDTILLTVALATHDAERIVWAMEGYEQPADYIPYVGVWVTLQNEATDTSGSSPVNESNVRQ
jgi:Flp pilus assembly protein CpaB